MPKPAIAPRPKPSLPSAKPGVAPGFPQPMEDKKWTNTIRFSICQSGEGAFGQDFVSAFDGSINLFAGPSQDFSLFNLRQL